MQLLRLLAIIGFGAVICSCDQKAQPEGDNNLDQETEVELLATGEIDPDTELDMEAQLAQDMEMLKNDSTAMLMDKLMLRQQISMMKMDPEKAADYEEGIQALMQSGQLEKMKKKGDIAPDFTVVNTKGEKVSLYQELKEKPVVLVWYRGGWCPYCNLTLQEYADYNDDIEAEGYQILAISPEMVDSAYSTSSELGLPFEVLSDKGNMAAEKFGLKFKLTDKVKKWYDKSFGMETYNGDDSGTLPIAGTYIIGKDKKIVEAMVLPDYRMRVGPKEVLGVVTGM